jgi:uncharacterized SAM-binding protein YcdF (DUF218 family)
MFFLLSKVFWLIAAPSNLIGVMIVAGLIALITKRLRRLGRFFIVAGLTALVVCGLGPLGVWIIRPLEDRFERPSELAAPRGIIVLGGAISPEMFQSRSALVPLGGRLTEAVALWRRFPDAQVVFVGGSSDGNSIPEAEVAGKLFMNLGLPREKILYENRSRNTFENAEFSWELLKPRSEDKWILVTSASHMPRAMAVFRHFGFNVIAWPADYQSLGTTRELVGFSLSAAAGLVVCDLAVKEWIGLAAYRLTGRTDQFLPK